MASDQLTRSSSWSSTLGSLLMNANNPRRVPASFLNERTTRHPPGDIWRRTLVTSVFSDLAANIGIGLRRFIRLQDSGLSGVLLYELPADSAEEENENSDNTLTLVKIFGDPNDPSQPGMEVDELLDMVRAKLVYFPSFACTSFVIGQVMTAFLTNEPSVIPIPALHGFCVHPQPHRNAHRSANFQTPLTRFVRLFSSTPSEMEEDGGQAHEEGENEQNQSSILAPDAEHESPIADKDPRPPQPTLSAPEPEALKQQRSNTPSDDSEDDSNSSLATTDSIGPRTPPRLTPSGTEQYPSHREYTGFSISPPGMQLGDSSEEGLVRIEALDLGEIKEPKSEEATL
ncbi:hypothetical protein AX16_001337 [Volvariella volvacea WC 439]|nr:hypothetical protein AX16_001337 [Volvariella volvacea WC 439]